MRCAGCDEETPNTPCEHCGEEALLDGRYALIEEVGRGTSGTTWRARAADGSVLALKEMAFARAAGEKTQALWMREAAVLRQLDHPSIPKFVEVFLVGKGRSRSLCLVQEFVEGVPLSVEMQAHRYTQEEVLSIAEELALVLDYLHALSPPVIHRDLKPANVMRRADGRLMLIDFGSVRDALADADLGGSTVAGTFGFMAPEQFRGEAVAATDYYALGSLMVALLTRRRPADLMGHDRTLAWKPHCEVSPKLDRLLTGLLRSDPAKRSTGAASFQALKGLSYAEPEVSEAAKLFDPTPAAQLPGRPVNSVPAQTGAIPPKTLAFVTVLIIMSMVLAGVVISVGLGFLALVS